MKKAQLKEFLEEKTDLYNRKSFIESDPISIPHRFSKKEDIEIAGFLSATIAWGQRPVILKNAVKLMQLMEFAPHDFLMNATEQDYQRFQGFKHRTFNDEDLTFFLRSLQNIYQNHQGLEKAFSSGLSGKEATVVEAIESFRNLFFSLEHPARTRKHVSSPLKGSAAKRINMYLRWMVRKDNRNVDFGIWSSIQPSQLLCPLDLHSGRIARKLGLLTRKQDDWKATEELTEQLKQLDPRDPVKYDFALFGLGINEKF